MRFCFLLYHFRRCWRLGVRSCKKKPINACHFHCSFNNAMFISIHPLISSHKWKSDENGFLNRQLGMLELHRSAINGSNGNPRKLCGLWNTKKRANEMRRWKKGKICTIYLRHIQMKKFRTKTMKLRVVQSAYCVVKVIQLQSNSITNCQSTWLCLPSNNSYDLHPLLSLKLMKIYIAEDCE